MAKAVYPKEPKFTIVEDWAGLYQDLKEDIIDIIDSENSGLSAEQRLNEIKKLVKK